MAIVEMKRVALVGPPDTREAVLAALQNVAVMDAVPLVEVEDPPADLVSRKMAVHRVITALETQRKRLRNNAPELSKRAGTETAEETIARVEELLARCNELESRLSLLTKERDQAAPWGDFDPSDLTMLAERGIYLQLFAVDKDVLQEVDLSAAAWVGRIQLDAKGKRIGLVVLSLDAPLGLPLDPATIPTQSLGRIQQKISSAQKEIAASVDELGRLSADLPVLQRYGRRILDQLQYAKVKAGLGGDEELFAISGWCPTERVDSLHQVVAGLPVAVIVEDPDEQDEVPIALTNRPGVRQFEPLLRAFNLPNYREYDPTFFIAPFMGIFFGFCLGDVGYGIVLTALSAWALSRFKPEGEIRLALQAAVIMGLCTVLIGGLIGNLFGMQLYKLFDWPESAALFVLNANPATFFYASLGFGIVQLSVGMIIRLVRDCKLGKWQNALGTIGWLSVFPAIALWIMAGTPWVFVGSLVVILFFASPSPSLLRRIGGGAWALYNISGLLGDVMSYARIFGLGLSSGIIAIVVNTIAMTVAGSVPVLGWILAAVILLVGHTFNFLMAIIGSVVHPARLQFLEFFGKFFEGGGRPYAPFQKLEGE